MNNMKSKITFIFLLAGCLSFSQSKTELTEQITRQQKTIDSLKSVVENYENIVENRDRSIWILKEDIAKADKEKEELNTKIRQKNAELIKLRNQNKSGVASKITMNNTRAVWTVPAGKHWIINQFIGDYITDLQKDSLGVTTGKEIHVFLKSINDVVLTDIEKNLYGPQLYSSITPHHTIRFPLVLTENTKFSIAVYKGSIGSLELYSGNIVCTYYEKLN